MVHRDFQDCELILQRLVGKLQDGTAIYVYVSLYVYISLGKTPLLSLLFVKLAQSRSFAPSNMNINRRHWPVDGHMS